LAEWDGIVYAQHPHHKATFFFVEAKQVTSIGKYKKVLKRLAFMKDVYVPLIDKHRIHDDDDDDYKDTARKFLKFIVKNPEYELGAVIAGPFYPIGLQEKIISDNLVSCVFLQSDLYKASVVTGPVFTAAAADDEP